MLLAAKQRPHTISSQFTHEEYSHVTVERDVKIYLDGIWRHYFSDVPRKNEIQIVYGSPWKTRLGMIRMTLDEAISLISVNVLLQHAAVPEYVLVTTIAHELAHYTHGFGSPLPRLYSHPHAHNVVNKELVKRGLKEYVQLSDKWIDNYWFEFYQQERNATWVTEMRKDLLLDSAIWKSVPTHGRPSVL